MDVFESLTKGSLSRALTYRSLFGLIAAAGLRLYAKFHKSRRLPLHPSTVRELELYRQARDRCQSTEDSAAFFVSHDGGHLPTRTVENVFRCLQPGLGWCARGDHPYPRILCVSDSGVAVASRGHTK